MSFRYPEAGADLQLGLDTMAGDCTKLTLSLR